MEDRQGASAKVTTNCRYRLGDRVVWMSDYGPEGGFVKWVGVLPDARCSDDVVIGIEFDNKIGSGTGVYKRQRLFHAKQGHASLVPQLGLIKEDEFYISEQTGIGSQNHCSSSLGAEQQSFHLLNRGGNIYQRRGGIQRPMEKRPGGHIKWRGKYQCRSRSQRRERNQGGGREGNTGGDFRGERSFEVGSECWSEESEVENEEKHSDWENGSKFKGPSTCPEENKVFEYFIKVGGLSSFNNIAKSNLFPKDFDISSWFYSHQDWFILFKNKEKIHCIVPFYKKATFCLHYNGLSKRKRCDNSDCPHAHVCKNFIGGSCKEGEKCQFSHDFFDRVNSGLVYKLGLNMFNNDEIRLIYNHRFPHVCYKHAIEHICRRQVCAHLHICVKSLLGKCKEEFTCPWGHSLRTDHNKYVLTAYEMAHWEEHLIKNMIFTSCFSISELKTSNHNPDVGGAKPKEPSPKHRNLDKDCKVYKDLILEMDTAQSNPICDSYIVGKCKTAGCRYHHIDSIKLPYIWQIRISDKWLTLDKLQMNKVERDYCNKKSTCPIMISYGGSIFNATFMFPKTDIMTAVVTMEGQVPKTISVRRLSTKSYAEETKLSKEASFKTQWRWYYPDGFGIWCLFEPELLQFTLEQKYTRKCQETYLFCRQSFSYQIDLKQMKQTNMDTGKERELLRRPLFVSSDDVESKHYPAMISIPTGANTPFPSHWVPWDLAHKFELVKLQRDSNEFKGVENSFFTTLLRNKMHINDICRVQNMDLWTAYCGQKKSMKGSLERGGQTKNVDERSLFHGTDSLDSVRGICTNCFDFRVCGKNGTAFGKGAYFARDASYSHSYTKSSTVTKERYMFLAKVLVGEHTTGSSSYTRPPNKPGGTGHLLFDSCVDSMNNPSIFVVFDLKQCYPEYLICYTNLEEFPVRKATSVSLNKNATPSRVSQHQSTQIHIQSTLPVDSSQLSARSSYDYSCQMSQGKGYTVKMSSSKKSDCCIL